MLNAGLKDGFAATAARALRIASASGFRCRPRGRLPATVLIVMPFLIAGCGGTGSVFEPPLPIPDPSGRPSETGSHVQMNEAPGTQLFAGRHSQVQQNTLPPPRTRESAAAAPPRSAHAPRRARAFPAASATGQAAVRSTPVTERGEPATAAATIRFTPVVGAPIDAIRPLSDALENVAGRKGITIQTTADSPPDNILRGYFSASKAGKRTRIVYVWDILDAQGHQLYRIEGTKTVPGGGKDAWSSVTDSTMRAIARRTIDGYLAWRRSRSG